MKVKFELDLTTDQLIQLLTNINDSITKETFESNTPPKQSEISRLRLFMEVFRALSTNNGKEDDADIHKDLLFQELIATGRFTLDQCKEMLKKAEQNGQIYQRRKDWYAKA
jgi:hypothetical protein